MNGLKQVFQDTAPKKSNPETENQGSFLQEIKRLDPEPINSSHVMKNRINEILAKRGDDINSPHWVHGTYSSYIQWSEVDISKAITSKGLGDMLDVSLDMSNFLAQQSLKKIGYKNFDRCLKHWQQLKLLLDFQDMINQKIKEQLKKQ